MKDQTELFEKNLDAFAKYAPDIHQILVSYTPSAEIVHHDNGEPDIRFQDVHLYGAGAGTYARETLEKYWKAPTRVVLNPMNSNIFDEYAGEFLAKVLKRGIDQGMEFLTEPRGHEAYHVVVFGVGLGAHLDEIAEKTQCRHLVLVEPNHEFIYHSLSLYDWRPLFERFEERKGKVNIVVSENYQFLDITIRMKIRAVNACAIDGTQIIHHYMNGVFQETHKLLMQNMFNVLTGLGFFDDEMGMITNTFLTLNKGGQRILWDTPKRQRVPVFIIAAGPSLDDDMDFLLENREKAIVIACGTALRPLLKAGIKPDFLIELERGGQVYDILAPLADEHDIRDVVLVASTTVDPRISDLFDQRIYYFRDALSPFPLFGDSRAILYWPSPTVVNSGLSFAQQAGFTEFYLFGTDLGTWDPEQHHAAATDYYEGAEVEEEKEFKDPYPGNFGGTVYTGMILKWSKNELEDAISNNAIGAAYYNCSDGVLIKGTIPAHSSSVELSGGEIDRAKVVGDIFNAMQPYERDAFVHVWNEANIFDILDSVHADIIKACEEADPNDPMEILGDLYRSVVPAENPGRRFAGMLVYRGTVFMAMVAVSFYFLRVSKAGQVADLGRIFVEEMKIMEDMLRDKARKTMEELNDMLAEDERISLS